MAEPTPPTNAVAAQPVSARPVAQPLTTGLSLLWPALWVAALLLAVAAAAGLAGRWLLTTEPGALWLLQRLPGVQVQGWQGSVLGGTWQAEKLRVQWGTEAEWVQVDSLNATGVQWAWRPQPTAWAGLQVQLLQARLVTVHTGPRGKRPLPVPASLALPLRVQVAQVQVATLQVDDLPALQQLQAQDLLLDTKPGSQHTLAQAQAQWVGLQLQGSASIGITAPLPVVLQLDAKPLLVVGTAAAHTPWAAAARVQGDLARLQLQGNLRAVPGPAAHNKPARSVNQPTNQALDQPAVDITAELRLLEDWPLGAVNLQTTALDLSALSQQAPRTRLSGSLQIASSSASAPVSAQVSLANQLPGRWNEGSVPIRSLRGELQGQLNARDRISAKGLDIEFGDGTGPAGAAGSAGRWQGSAQWVGHELALQTQLQAVQPNRLDGRAAAMRLNGPANVTIKGLPSPDGKPAAVGAGASAAAGLQASWQVDLEGSLQQAPLPVRLAMQGQASAGSINITQARATSGAASADLTLAVQRGVGDWAMQSQGTLKDFEPLPWWPGEVGSAWRQGTHRLSGQWQVNLRLPPSLSGLSAMAVAQRVAGTGTVQLADSVLAGVPMAADIKLSQSRADASAQSARQALTTELNADLRVGGNQLLVQAKGDPSGAATSSNPDRWRAELKADNLATLAPITRLHPALADWVPQRGAATGTLVADGRWPLLRTEGHARITQLRVGNLQLANGTANWQLDTTGDKPLQLVMDLVGLQLGESAPADDKRIDAKKNDPKKPAPTRADQLHAELKGTLASHQLSLSGVVPVGLPDTAMQLLNLPPSNSTRALLQAQGAWQKDSAGGGTWRGSVERLVLGAGSLAVNTANTATAQALLAPNSAWAETRDLKAQAQFNADGKLLNLQADPGRLVLANGAVAMRWEAVKLDLSRELPYLNLRADIEPFAVVPALARAAPGVPWRGDLKLTARIDIQASERFDADVVFERQSGDLQVESGEGLQGLGLNDFRLLLSAHDGNWQFTPVFKGRTLGEVAGSVRVQTTPERRWPHPEAPVEGVVQARVADLGVWGTWVPPGWRLFGELRTSAVVGGRFADPRYTGELSGSGLGVRNLLQGVNVGGGELTVKLAGDTATIERFSLKGGEGSISVTGDATIGANPQARLQLKADKFRALGRVDRLVIASGNAALNLTPDLGKLEGRFKLDEGLFDASRRDAPTLDDDVTVKRPGNTPEPEADTPVPRTKRNFVMAVDVDLGEDLRVKGRGLDTELRGQLRLSSNAGRLNVEGNIFTETGTYAAYGQKLTVERGRLAFSGPVDNPRLDVLALRPNTDMRVGVAITGNLLTPRVRLFSEPEMSDTDKLSWLVLGRAPDGLGRSDTALLQRAAVALLSGEGEAPTDTLLKSLGIDELSLRQSEGDVRETVVSLGKQLSRRWYVGYERGVNATTGTWQLVYRIAQRFTLRAQSGLDNSLDMIWIWRVGEAAKDGTKETNKDAAKDAARAGAAAPTPPPPAQPARPASP